MKKKVYISVFKNEQIVDYARVLVEKFDYDIVSSGDTLELLRKNNLIVEDISDLALSEGFYKKTFMEDYVSKSIDMVIIMFRPIDDIAEKTDDIRESIFDFNKFSISSFSVSEIKLLTASGALRHK